MRGRYENTPLLAILTTEQRQAGLWLQEDEDFVYLRRGISEVLATFNSKVVEVQAIREEASKYA